MSRWAEYERRKMWQSGSPLSSHSMSSKNIKDSYQGEQRITPTTLKIEHAQKRRERIARETAIEIAEHEQEKLLRIWRNASFNLNRYDGCCGKILANEVRFLKKNGISPRQIKNGPHS